MDEARLRRKIAVIMAADVVGYSRLVAENEDATLKRLMEYREIFADFVSRGRGRIFNTAGDAVLAEFDSAVEAVRAAMDIQEALKTRNALIADKQRMIFRIGVSLGDVVGRDGDLLGDGVNIAARLQALAAPG
ncbi:MAG: adenylate/guanylate cyclase domain-containing protein, partial [Hyphomicrobiales bacterium]